MGLKVLPIEGPTKLAKKKATFSFLVLFLLRADGQD